MTMTNNHSSNHHHHHEDEDDEDVYHSNELLRAFHQGKGTIFDTGTSDIYFPKRFAYRFHHVWYQITNRHYSNQPMLYYYDHHDDLISLLPTVTLIFQNNISYHIDPYQYMHGNENKNENHPLRHEFFFPNHHHHHHHHHHDRKHNDNKSMNQTTFPRNMIKYRNNGKDNNDTNRNQWTVNNMNNQQTCHHQPCCHDKRDDIDNENDHDDDSIPLHKSRTIVLTSRIYFTEHTGAVLGMNSMRGYDIFFDVEHQRIGIASAAC
jgi:hypothetical protein